MEVRLTIIKDFNSIGEKYVRLVLESDSLTYKVFVKGSSSMRLFKPNGKILRQVEDGIFVGNQDDYEDCVFLEISNEEELKRFLNRIKNLYGKVFKNVKDWDGSEEVVWKFE
jgi:hypothetical protein